MELLERASVLDELDGVLAALLAAGSSRERLFAALLDELDQGTRPQVVVVEDAHWADEATLDLLRFLAPPLGPAATLMVVTYRDDEVGLQHRVQLLAGDLASSALFRRPRLAPLSRRGVAVLAELEGLSARPLAAAVARKLRGLGVRGLARGPRPATSATRPTSRPGRPRWRRWSPRGCATPTSPGACSSPPRRSTTTSPPS
jgi:hypothetical protein